MVIEIEKIIGDLESNMTLENEEAKRKLVELLTQSEFFGFRYPFHSHGFHIPQYPTPQTRNSGWCSSCWTTSSKPDLSAFWRCWSRLRRRTMASSLTG